MDVPILLSPTAPRLHPHRSHTRNASRSPTRERITDDILADLSPATTLEAFANPSGKLKASIETATSAERAFAIRATLAQKKIQEWVDELSDWPWPADGGSKGFQAPLQSSNTDAEEEEYMGSLLAEDVVRYEVRIEEIMEDMEDLNVEEIKRQVLDTHFSAKSRPSSSSSNAPLPNLWASYTKMDDLTAIITATVLQALPNLSKLMRMMDVWSIRLIVLKKVPRLLLALDGAEAALVSGPEALKIPTNLDKPSGREGEVIPRQIFEVMRNVLQDKVTTLGQDLDFMLDTLEGREDTLPEGWLDRMEIIEQNYGEWVVSQDRKIREAEWAKLEQDQRDEDARRAREAEIAENERRKAEKAALDARRLEEEQAAEDAIILEEKRAAENARRLEEEYAAEHARISQEQAAQEARHKAKLEAEEMKGLEEHKAAEITLKMAGQDSQIANIVPDINNQASEDVKAASAEAFSAENAEDKRKLGVHVAKAAEEAVATTPEPGLRDTEVMAGKNEVSHAPLPQEIECIVGSIVERVAVAEGQPGSLQEPEIVEEELKKTPEAITGLAGVSDSIAANQLSTPGTIDDNSTQPVEFDVNSQISDTSAFYNERSTSESYEPSLGATSEKLDYSVSGLKGSPDEYVDPAPIDTDAISPVPTEALAAGIDSDVNIPTPRRNSVSSDTATIVTGWSDDAMAPSDFASTTTNSGMEYNPDIIDQSPTAGRVGSRRGPSGDSKRPEPLQLMPSSCRRQSTGSPSSPTFSFSDLSDASTLYVDPPVLENIDVSDDMLDGPSLTSPKKSSGDQLQQQISSLLESIPARIHLTSEPDLNPSHTLKLKKTRRSVTPSSRSHSSLSNRAPTPSFLLSPAYNKTASRPRPQSAHPEIKLYHLSRSTGEAPIKLFVRLVGENGERVMVRVGGGWADLGEYLKEYASHHGRRSAAEKDKIEIQDIPRRIVSNSSTTSSTSTIRANESGRASPINQFRPASAFGRPMSSLNVRKTRKSVNESAATQSMRNPSTPLPIQNRRPLGETPPSNSSDRSSSRLSWTDEDSSLGLAGPKAKKVVISEQDQEWVESMKEKVRQASAEKDREKEKERRARERGTSFGEMDKVGGTKRLFKKG